MDKKTALEIYKINIQQQVDWLNLHRQYSQQFFTLIIALLGVCLGATY